MAGQPPGKQPAAAKRRGCITSLSGALLFAVAVILLIHPWALHMGGRWTPALTWHGGGTLESSSGARYLLFLEVWLDRERGRSAKALAGRARLCTPDGEPHELKVDGYVKGVWWNLEGRPVTFTFSNAKEAVPRLKFTLSGSWQGQRLVLEDQGSMALSFASDGRAKGYLAGATAPRESTTGRLAYGTAEQFPCGGKSGTSF